MCNLCLVDRGEPRHDVIQYGLRQLRDLAAVAGLEIWRFGYRGLGRAFWAIVVAGLPLAYPVAIIRRAAVRAFTGLGPGLRPITARWSPHGRGGVVRTRTGHTPLPLDISSSATSFRAMAAGLTAPCVGVLLPVQAA